MVAGGKQVGYVTIDQGLLMYEVQRTRVIRYLRKLWLACYTCWLITLFRYLDIASNTVSLRRNFWIRLGSWSFDRMKSRKNTSLSIMILLDHPRNTDRHKPTIKTRVDFIINYQYIISPLSFITLLDSFDVATGSNTERFVNRIH